MKNWLCILALLASPALAQPGHGPISGGGAGQSSGGAATAVTGSASLPATCAEKDLYQDTDSGGTEFYVCTATNTWTKTIAATDNAATATALAANGANCTAGNYPLGVDASGAVESCTAVPGGSDPTLAGDVDGLGSANDLDEVAVEAELEAVLDLPDLQGAVPMLKFRMRSRSTLQRSPRQRPRRTLATVQRRSSRLERSRQRGCRLTMTSRRQVTSARSP